MKYVKPLLAISIAVAATFGDYVVFKSKFSKSQVFRAVADSAVHATIGLLSALSFFSHEINITYQGLLFNVAFCTVISSLIDIDHVLVAKSFVWKDLISLKQRGLFHCTSFWILVASLLLSYSCYTKKLHIYTLTWMLIVAFTSHHIRDGNRRGLWFYPFGHTPPINTSLYIIISSVLPYLLALIYKLIKPSVYKHTVVEYVPV